MLTRFYKWLTSWRVIRVLLGCLLVLVLVGIIVGLGFINRHYHVETELLSPFPRLHPYWLPLLFVLVLIGAVLGYWFFKLLTDPRTGEYPDIDDAWAEALAALGAAGINPRELPLFLVVGTPRTAPVDFFAATKLPFTVRAAPRRPDAPIAVFASREAVFVTCEGASALTRLSQFLAARRQANENVPTEPGGVNLLDSPAAPVDVLAGEMPAAGATIAAPIAAQPSTDVWLPTAETGNPIALPTDERDRCARRLKYLCQLVADRRRPYCPANGIIWLLPLEGTESGTMAEEVANACRADLAAAEAGLQVYCPSVAVVCDAQELPGFRDLLHGLPDSAARERLLGRSFPLVPGVTPEQRPGVWIGGIDWMARHLVPAVVYQRFGSEAEGNGERWSAANTRLWSLTAELHERRAALVRLLGQGLIGESVRPPMLAGVYLAGTGPDERDQAFAAGVVRQLIGLQNSVAWTEAAVAEERDYRRMTDIGYAAVAALVIAVAVFGYSTWYR